MQARPMAMLWAFVGLLGCSGDDDTRGPGVLPSPKLLIISPKDGADVVVTPETDNGESKLEASLSLSVQNFTLRKPGVCAGAASCGHVHVQIDGDACNATDPNGTPLPYNQEAFAFMVAADFAHCDGAVDGAHTISVALHDDAEAVVVDAAGEPLADSVNVTVEVEGGGGGAGGTGGAGGAGGAGGG